MRTKKIDTGFYNQKAEDLIATSISEIQIQNKTYATDMARQSRPLVDDPQELFIPKIKGWFEVLLQKVLQIIGAFAVMNQTPEIVEALYEKEMEKLQEKKDALFEDARLLQKELEGLNDLSGIINRWRYKWRPVLILLTFGEVAVNYKALLTVTPNQLVAVIASIGLSIFLFITAHSFKDILNFFPSKQAKIAVGTLNVLLVVFLLISLNGIRLSYMENNGAYISDTSKYSFIVLNFALWISGVIIALLYKPLKLQITKHRQYQEIKKEHQGIKSELSRIGDRMEAIPNEQAQKLLDLRNLRSMAKHYENIVSADYESAVADFKEHNLFSRKDKVTPKAFLEKPPRLRTYFDHIHPNTQQL